MAILYIIIAVLSVLLVYTTFKYKAVIRYHSQEEASIRKKLNTAEQIMNHVDTCFVLVNKDFVVQETNYYAINHVPASTDEVRLGDLLHCRNAIEAKGCGMHERCALCSIRSIISHSFSKKMDFRKLEAKMNLLNEEEKQITPCDVYVSGTYLNTGEGGEQMVLTVCDITELKNVERLLSIEKENAISADKLKSAFIANMSHEIRTPLNSIVGFSGLLASASSEEEKKMFADIISQNNDRLLQLVNDILDLSQIEAGVVNFEYSEFDVNDILRELHGIFALKLMRDNPAIKMVCESNMEPTQLYSERERVVQVMTNLIHNAIKFTKEGEIRFGFDYKEKDIIRFYVSDTGIGIPPEEQSQVFCRFTKLDKEVPGTGLGLSLAQTIVQNLGGEIGVESEVEKGSTFWFTVPVVTMKSREQVSA